MHLVHSQKCRLTALLAVLALALGVAAAPASAQTQNGLVNVAVVGNTVQVPIAVAANVCNVQVGVLAANLRQGPAECNALANATATAPAGGGGAGGTQQQGLVNLAIENNTIQVPIGIAANICNVQAAILAAQLTQGAANCDAQGNATATGV